MSQWDNAQLIVVAAVPAARPSWDRDDLVERSARRDELGDPVCLSAAEDSESVRERAAGSYNP
jgi:hypothetical protein